MTNAARMIFYCSAAIELVHYLLYNLCVSIQFYPQITLNSGHFVPFTPVKAWRLASIIALLFTLSLFAERFWFGDPFGWDRSRSIFQSATPLGSFSFGSFGWLTIYHRIDNLQFSIIGSISIESVIFDLSYSFPTSRIPAFILSFLISLFFFFIL